jgi:hypothetical protein
MVAVEQTRCIKSSPWIHAWACACALLVLSLTDVRCVRVFVWLLCAIASFTTLHGASQLPLPLVLLLLVGETLAASWYSASYVPWGRKMIIACCQASLFSPCPEALKPIGDQV